MNMHIKQPHISEKTLSLASRGWYTFVVENTHGRKEDIAREIEKLYNVNVVSVRTISMHGKARRSGRRMRVVRCSDWKKVIVKLKNGQTIDAFEVTKQDQKGEGI